MGPDWRLFLELSFDVRRNPDQFLRSQEDQVLGKSIDLLYIILRSCRLTTTLALSTSPFNATFADGMVEIKIESDTFMFEIDHNVVMRLWKVMQHGLALKYKSQEIDTPECLKNNLPLVDELLSSSESVYRIRSILLYIPHGSGVESCICCSLHDKMLELLQRSPTVFRQLFFPSKLPPKEAHCWIKLLYRYRRLIFSSKNLNVDEQFLEHLLRVASKFTDLLREIVEIQSMSELYKFDYPIYPKLLEILVKETLRLEDTGVCCKVLMSMSRIPEDHFIPLVFDIIPRIDRPYVASDSQQTVLKLLFDILISRKIATDALLEAIFKIVLKIDAAGTILSFAEWAHLNRAWTASHANDLLKMLSGLRNCIQPILRLFSVENVDPALVSNWIVANYRKIRATHSRGQLYAAIINAIPGFNIGDILRIVNSDLLSVGQRLDIVSRFEIRDMYAEMKTFIESIPQIEDIFGFKSLMRFSDRAPSGIHKVQRLLLECFTPARRDIFDLRSTCHSVSKQLIFHSRCLSSSSVENASRFRGTLLGLYLVSFPDVERGPTIWGAFMEGYSRYYTNIHKDFPFWIYEPDESCVDKLWSLKEIDISSDELFEIACHLFAMTPPFNAQCPPAPLFDPNLTRVWPSVEYAKALSSEADDLSPTWLPSNIIIAPRLNYLYGNLRNGKIDGEFLEKAPLPMLFSILELSDFLGNSLLFTWAKETLCSRIYEQACEYRPIFSFVNIRVDRLWLEPWEILEVYMNLPRTIQLMCPDLSSIIMRFFYKNLFFFLRNEDFRKFFQATSDSDFLKSIKLE